MHLMPVLAQIRQLLLSFLTVMIYYGSSLAAVFPAEYLRNNRHST